MSTPTIRLKGDRSARIKAGSPWIYSNELEMPAKNTIAPGSVVRIANARGHALGLYHFNPNSLIAGRRLTGNSERAIDASWLGARLKRARDLRDSLFDAPFYRLSHGEADGLPGLIIDRYGDIFVIQCNSAGMDSMTSDIRDALIKTLDAKHIIARNDSPARALEGLGQESQWLLGGTTDPVIIQEGGFRFTASLETGQKTGWYYDQRDNRRLFGSLAKDRKVLDLYAYAGGFGIAAAVGGARFTLCIDSSKPAIERAKEAASLNQPAASDKPVAKDMDFEAADAFDALASMQADKQHFDLISADPPPFARSKKDVGPALKAYQKLARLSASITTEGGMLALSCCSHNIRDDAFIAECHKGIRQSGRSASILTQRGADLDHPMHPALPETAYLRFVLFHLD